jgi:hypothetical protein
MSVQRITPKDAEEMRGYAGDLRPERRGHPPLFRAVVERERAEQDEL